MLDNDTGCNIASHVSLQDWSYVLRRTVRGGIESAQLSNLQQLIRDVVLSDNNDSWNLSLDITKGFNVASVRSLIDSCILEVSPIATRWNRSIPIKVNIFLWRLLLNKLPSRVNLDRRGIGVHSLLCPICQDDVETVNHIFFSCEMATDLWSLLAKWWELDIPFCASMEDWIMWLDTSSFSKNVQVFLEGVGRVLLWSIWSFRNRLVFSNPPPRKAMIWDNVVSQSFLWISSRNPNFKLSLVGWLQNPITTISSL